MRLDVPYHQLFPWTLFFFDVPESLIHLLPFTDIRLVCRPDFFSSLFLKSKVKVLFAMVLRSHYSQLLLLSESLMMLPNFLNHCVIHQDLVEHVDNQKRFQ